ncbi:protein DGS1, mitochondrial [Tanacetum coccineum]
MEDIDDLLWLEEPHYPLPYVSPHSAHILEYYPLFNDLFNVTLLYLEYVMNSLLGWESLVMTQPDGALNMQDATHAVKALEIIRVNLSIFLSKFEEFFLAFEASVQLSPLTSLELAGVKSFEKIPVGSKWWTHDVGSRFYTFLIDCNGDKLHTYLFAMLSRYQVPKIRSHKWMYALGAIGVSIFTIWMLSKKRDINEVSYQEAFANFCSDHIKKPLASIREDLFNKVTQSDGDEKNIKEATDVYLRMVEDYSGETPLLDDEKTSEAVNIRLKQDFDHPIQAVFNGGFFQAILIRVQRLFVDYEMGRHWISGFYRINKKTIAFIYALPAILPGCLLFCGISIASLAMVYFAKKSERKLVEAMLADVEKSVIEHTNYRAEEGQEVDQV